MARTRTPGSRVRAPLGLLALGVLTGCSSSAPSALDPHGPASSRIATLWWVLFGFAVLACAVVIGLLLVAVLVRRGRDTKVRTGTGTRFVVVAGIVLPAIVLTSVYGLGLHDMAALGSEQKGAGVTVDVTGHEWWWEVSYPGRSVVTANEIHIPVGERIHIRLRTADVIHSFWVPQLAAKQDLIAGQTNHLWLQADKAGSYRGQCAEYCGVQHGHMAFMVVAQSRSKFDAWVADQAADARTPTSALSARGEQAVTTGSCASCHTIRGTAADGDVGPDLTHVGSRSQLAAGTIPNTRGFLGGWIANSQTVKPGNKMPPQPLSPDDLRAVVTYLESLR